MSGDVEQDRDDELLERLRAEVPVDERLRAFKDLGLKPLQVRAGIAISPETWRLWSKGGPVRRSNRLVIDNLGQAATILLRATGDRAEVVHWLTTPFDPRSPAPLGLIRDQPEAVLAAAEAQASGRTEQAREFLGQAVESGRNADRASGSRDIVGTSDWSSTQLKRLLLARLHEVTANHTSAREVILPVDERYANYEAYRHFLKKVNRLLEDAGDAPAETAISRLLVKTSADEEDLREEFGALGAELVDDSCTTILTYSMSVRVIQALRGVSQAKQATCQLYVAEGRVKSVPQFGDLPAFADAAEILRFLDYTSYDRCIVPDALAPSLVAQGRVDLVLLGAQKVFADGDEPTHVLATAGTDAILRAARDHGVTVRVLVEEEKVTPPPLDYDPRERIVPVSLPPAADGSAGGHARLLMMSAELCNITRDDPDAIGDPSIVRRKGRAREMIA
jgi:hypothetical protein